MIYPVNPDLSVVNQKWLTYNLTQKAEKVKDTKHAALSQQVYNNK